MLPRDSTRTASTSAVWPTTGMGYGGDYNPDQWTPDVWREDIRLMQEANVNIVTLGVFSWSQLEPRDGEYEWGWFDEIIGLLSDAGIAIDLATPTASPPNWLFTLHPEVLWVDPYMTPHNPGGRLGWCPSSPVFRRYAVRIVEQLAKRYGSHPSVKLWHVSNELGGGNGRCYCEVSAARFREWLAERYPSIHAVNDAWTTAFWGHRFDSFDEVDPPRGREMSNNPGLLLDFARFSSDELLDHFRAESDVLRAHSSAPVTTNFMVNAGAQAVQYSKWAEFVDIVANDHYTIVDDPDRAIELSFSADRMRGLAGNQSPWMLMEHSTGIPAWQPRNRAKAPNEILRNSLAHVARGSDSAMFFQWRASLGGAEQWHSAMLPHSGTNTRVWREVVALGAGLKALNPVAGSLVEPAKVALLVDEVSAWAFESGLKPNHTLKYSREPRLWYSALWNRQVLVDVLPAAAALNEYSLVIIPSLYIAAPGLQERVEEYVRSGGTVLVTYLSGIADEHAKILPGGYPGAFRDVLGVFAEEFRPLQTYESVTLDDGTTVRDWTEDIVLTGAEAVLSYADGDGAGRAAVTRNRVDGGTAWYVSAALSPESAQRLIDGLISDLGLPRVVDAPAGLEAVRRITDDGDVLFLINHTDDAVDVAAHGTDLLSGERFDTVTRVSSGQVIVLEESP